MRRLLCMSVIASVAMPAVSEEEPVRSRLQPIVITPNRIEQSSFDLPVSIDVIDAEQIRSGQLQTNLSETLMRVPGIVAQNRQNYAQDLQISARGFGARSTFGIRGIRLFADGIPATSPDGQGQAATFDLGSARRIEVMRGPFSTLYGNSAGGVIAAFTEDGPTQPTATFDGAAGSFDTWKVGSKFAGQTGVLNYVGRIARFETDGFREHSAARRDQLSTKFTYAASEETDLTVVVSALRQPETLDPLGLTRAQAQADPSAAGPAALTFNTRKSVEHDQQGVVYERRLSAQESLRLLGYVGNRDVMQYLGFEGAGALASGGVVDLDRRFYGADVRYTHRDDESPLTFTLGAAYDDQEERRRGYVNDLGTAGDLRRDEDNRVYNADVYAQAEWRFLPRFVGTVGARRSEVRFRSTDYYIVGANPDDSGAVRYRATTPVAGLLFKANPRLNLYANAGRGFETPTFAELAYRSDGGSGLNTDLRPSKSDSYELGVKAFLGQQTRANVALFRVDTKNEIVVSSNVNGRSTFQNAGRTERRGAEAVLESEWGNGISAYFAFALLDAIYAEPFAACISAPPCTTPTVIPAGNRLPGVARRTAYAELAWKEQRRRFETALEARWSDEIFVNDINSEAADSYAVFNWRAGFEQRGAQWEASEFVRIDNLFDKRYIGSVIVNAGGGQFYEPSPGRNYLAGVRVLVRF